MSIGGGWSKWSQENGYTPQDHPGGRGWFHQVELASWARRVPGALIDDAAPTAVIVFLSGSAHFLIATVIVFLVWNAFMQGKTGQSLGKRLTGLVVFRSQFSEAEGAFVPVAPGIGTSFGRLIAHFVLDTGLLWVGWLRPLWQYDRRTFADSVCKTYVTDRENLTYLRTGVTGPYE
jgi:Mce-associated membrane protein